jgi:DNA polymerase/3'-5' exonuclease PolX
MASEVEAIARVPVSRIRVRRGKGFSISEIKKAGLNLQQAKKFSIPIDARRRTAWEENVQTLNKNYVSGVDLTEIKGVGKIIAAKLEAAGIMNANDLAKADLEELSEKVGYPVSRLEKLKQEAEKLLHRG